MFDYYSFSQFFQFIQVFLDIAILSLILYYAIKIVRNNSKTAQIFKGIIFVVILNGISSFIGLKTLSQITDIFVKWGLLAVIIIFQPEIRSLLEKLGKTNVFSKMTTLTGDVREVLVDELTNAAIVLSEKKVGALITIEQAQSLSEWVETGTAMNSFVTTELLTSLFVTSTPLHDGAVIIQGDRIACASAYFPPTERELPARYGARHRAALGISEITDSITIVISEESGIISVAEQGKLIAMTGEKLRNFLTIVFAKNEVRISETEVQAVEVIEDKYEKVYTSEEEVSPIEDLKLKDVFKKKKSTSRKFFRNRKAEDTDDLVQAKSVIFGEGKKEDEDEKKK